jgi:hypothetical protein
LKNYIKFQKVILIAFPCLFFLNTQGQEGNRETPTTKDYSYSQRILPSKDQVDIWSLNFGFSYLPVEDDYFVSNSLAANLGLNFNYEIILSFKPIQTLSLGLGYNHFRINHEGRFVNTAEDDFWIHGSTIDAFEKGNLRFHSAAVPLEYRLRLNNHFKLYLSYLPEYVFSVSDMAFIDGEKIRLNNLKGASDLMHGGQIRVGYKDFFLFCYYSFSSPLNYDLLEKQNIFRFGISIGG